jgi:hypothetical protein
MTAQIKKPDWMSELINHTQVALRSVSFKGKKLGQNSEAIHAVLTAAGMKNSVLLDVTPCRLVDRHSCTLNATACPHTAADTDPCSGPKPHAEHQALCQLIGCASDHQHGGDVTF